MKDWFNRLMARLAGRQTGTPQCMDWRGRPRGEDAAGAVPPHTLAEEDMYTTLRPPSFPEAGSAGQRSP